MNIEYHTPRTRSSNGGGAIDAWAPRVIGPTFNGPTALCSISEEPVPPTFLHFSPFSVFCINMTFAVLFQKMDPNLGAIIIGVEPSQSGVNSIGANQSYMDTNVAGVGADPWTSLHTWQGCQAKIYGADPLYTGTMLLFFLIFFSRLRSPAPLPPPPHRAAGRPALSYP
jgi:hypothetical protein